MRRNSLSNSDESAPVTPHSHPASSVSKPLSPEEAKEIAKNLRCRKIKLIIKHLRQSRVIAFGLVVMFTCLLSAGAIEIYLRCFLPEEIGPSFPVVRSGGMVPAAMKQQEGGSSPSGKITDKTPPSPPVNNRPDVKVYPPPPSTNNNSNNNKTPPPPTPLSPGNTGNDSAPSKISNNPLPITPIAPTGNTLPPAVIKEENPAPPVTITPTNYTLDPVEEVSESENEEKEEDSFSPLSLSSSPSSSLITTTDQSTQTEDIFDEATGKVDPVTTTTTIVIEEPEVNFNSEPVKVSSARPTSGSSADILIIEPPKPSILEYLTYNISIYKDIKDSSDLIIRFIPFAFNAATPPEKVFNHLRLVIASSLKSPFISTLEFKAEFEKWSTIVKNKKIDKYKNAVDEFIGFWESVCDAVQAHPLYPSFITTLNPVLPPSRGQDIADFLANTTSELPLIQPVTSQLCLSLVSDIINRLTLLISSLEQIIHGYNNTRLLSHFINDNNNPLFCINLHINYYNELITQVQPAQRAEVIKLLQEKSSP